MDVKFPLTTVSEAVVRLGKGKIYGLKTWREEIESTDPKQKRPAEQW